MALKQWDQALYHLGHATQAAQQREAYPLLWQIHRRMGELYRVQKHLEESDKEFTHASRIIQTLSKNIPDEEMQIRFLRNALEDLPKEGQISKRKQEAKLFGGLTLREREVARCLSEGKSNREIAEELVLSERTIENHVGNILRKLGFDSRAQVAVWVVEKGLLKN